MIRIGNNVLNEDFIKGIRVQLNLKSKIYFTDRTAKVFELGLIPSNIFDKLIKIDCGYNIVNYINPQNIKGFELIRTCVPEGDVLKVYFPDTTALSVLTEDAEDMFEDLVAYFNDRDKEE